MSKNLICALWAFLCMHGAATCQDLPSRLFNKIHSIQTNLDERLTRQTQKYLDRISKREERLEKKLSRIDPKSAALFTYSKQRYAELAGRMRSDTGSRLAALSGQYLPHTDSVRVALSFLQANPQLLDASGDAQARLRDASGELQQLQSKMLDADQAKQFIGERKDQIRQYLSHYTQLPSSISKEYQAMSQDLYYYSQQLGQYKEMLNHPDQLEQKALGLLDKLPAFRDFMKNNSQMAALFGAAPTGSVAAIAGLQTRSAIQQMITGQLAAGGPNAQAMIAGKLSEAGKGLSALRDRIGKLGDAGKDIEDPSFKPNDQRTRSFWNRLEYGLNLQTQHSDLYYPTTTDLGVSLGYRLSDNNTAGIGASAKIGWGKDIRHISPSGSGVGLRSFIDMHLKKTWFLSGGFEYNYQQRFTQLSQLPDIHSWQQSGLLGISKIISVKSRVFKKTKLQLLWDFLSYRQIPRTQPIQFRIGYTF